MHLIIGLGNPGTEFAGNRHNIGKMIVSGLARQLGIKFTNEHPKAEIARVTLNSQENLLAVLKDYMNVSGFAVDALCTYYEIDVRNLIIVHDDLDLPLGAIRIKQGGGSGGHNGLKSIIDVLGRDDFIRVRIGIGRPPGKMDPAEYVLSDFTVVQFAEMEIIMAEAIDAVKIVVLEGVEAAMNRYNMKRSAE